MIVALVAALALVPVQLPPPIQPPPLPCVPLVDPGCELPPLPPPPPPPDACLQPPLPPICLPLPPPSDDPPELPAGIEVKRQGQYVTLDWKPATDDVGVWGYRIYRDGDLIARRPKEATKARVKLPCGKHKFRVEAVDTVEQVASRILVLKRPC